MKKLFIRWGEGLCQGLAFAVLFLLALFHPKWWEWQLKKSEEARRMLGEEEHDVF